MNMKMNKVASGIAAVVLSTVCAVGSASISPVMADASLDSPPFTEEKLEFTASNGEKLAYYLVKPKDFDANSNYPLVVFLHGVGGDTDTSGYESLKKQLYSRGLNCVFLAPLADWNGGQTWIDYNAVLAPAHPHGTYDQSALQITPALAAAKELIESTKTTYHTDANRSYLLGVSMGGYGTWDLITRYPDLMTAAVPICGGCDPTVAKSVAEMPIWMFHGTKDAAVSVTCSQDMYAALLKEGSGKAKYTQYEGLDHGIWFKVFEEKEMLPWLFAQGTGIEDTFANFDLMQDHQSVTIETNRKFGDTTTNCLVRGTGEGSVTYCAQNDQTIADAKLKLTLLYNDMIYYMNKQNCESINDLIKLEVKVGSRWETLPVQMSQPATLGLVAGGAYTYSKVWLTPVNALPADVTAVRYTFSASYVNWYMMASGAEILYRPKESNISWEDPKPGNTDTWDGVTMTTGWDGFDDFNDLTHVVDSSNVKILTDPYVKQTVLSKTSNGDVGYIRYAQKGCYMTDFSIDASLIEGFLPKNISEWLTVSVRTAGSDEDVVIATAKTEGKLLHENDVPSYNYYSSTITPAVRLPKNTISIKVEFAKKYINYTMYFNSVTLTFDPMETSSTETSKSTSAQISDPSSVETSQVSAAQESSSQLTSGATSTGNPSNNASQGASSAEVSNVVTGSRQTPVAWLLMLLSAAFSAVLLLKGIRRKAA